MKTIYLENQFGEVSENYIIGGDSPAALQNAGIPLFVQRVKVGFAALNAATSGIALVLGDAIPNKAIIKQVWYNVITTFADNGTSTDQDSSTISIGANTAVDLKAAIAISNGANPWDAGIGAGIPVGTAAAMVKTTAARHINVTWTHGTGNSTALTAGEMDVFVEYAQGT